MGDARSSPLNFAHPGPAIAVAALAGVITVFGFAPFRQPWLPIVTVAILLQLIWRQSTVHGATGVAFVFGLSLFGAGVSWVYVSLTDFGGVGPLGAAALTALVCGYLASFVALFGALAWRVRQWPPLAQLLPAAGLWAGCEWLRGVVGGFPWLALGYSQVPESPLSNVAPWLGVHGVSAATVLVGVAFGSALVRRPGWQSAYMAAAVVGTISWIGEVPWTQPTGKPVPVALMQGNVAQETKWRPEERLAILERYAQMVETTGEGLVVAPETALPLFLDEVSPVYTARIQEHARLRQSVVVMGVVERAAHSASTQIYNAAVAMDGSGHSTYRKKHLVPFGEFVPLRPLLAGLAGRISIPMSDMTPGPREQQPWTFFTQRIAVNICFEDAFGAEIASSAATGTLLLNMSNLAWFGRSLGAAQHLQMAQTRSLETGRFSIRATNTGVTATIDQRGRIVDQVPQHREAVLTGSVQGYTGMTPYMRWRDTPMLATALAALAIIFVRSGSRARLGLRRSVS